MKFVYEGEIREVGQLSDRRDSVEITFRREGTIQQRVLELEIPISEAREYIAHLHREVRVTIEVVQ